MQIRTWKTWLGSAVVTGALVVATMAVTSQESDAAPVSSPTRSATTAPSSSVGMPVTEAVTTTDVLDAVEADGGGRFAVAVLDVDTGETLSYGSGTFDTASIVKVDILAALLWQHQQAGTTMSSSELAQAEAMIEQSDNDAATALFQAVGGESGLEAFNERAGLTSTDVGSGGDWGLTQTTADDQLRLLRVVLGDGTLLTSASQELARQLMADVVDGQRFGAAAAADDAGSAVVKAGYLQRSATGRWDVTSIGEIEAGGHTYLVAVLSDSSTSFDAGVALVDAAASAAVDQMN